MRLWLGLVPIFVLLSCLNAHIKHEPCPNGNVCIIFANDRCTSASKEWKDLPDPNYAGYIWRNHTVTPCQFGDYGHLYARLEIEPLSATNWKVLASLYKKGGEKTYKVNDYLFKFGNGELTFPNEDTVQFLYAEVGILKPSSDKSTTNNGTTTSTKFATVFDVNLWAINRYKFIRLSFEIDANGKYLIDFFGPTVEMKLSGTKITLYDIAFPEQLKLLTPESKSEGMTAQAKMLLGVGIGFGVLVMLVAAVIIVWYLRKKGKIGAKATIRDSDSKAQTPGSTRRSCPAIAPAYTPPAPYELANPYEAPVPPLPK